MAPRRAIRERILAHVAEDVNGCWIWQARISPSGYGFMINRRGGRVTGTTQAHRIAYEEFVGRIPDGLQIDHLCRVRACVNPAHLEPVTGRENQLRSPISLASINSRKASCVNGHPFDDQNTVWRKGGGRDCRACKAARQRKWLSGKYRAA